MLTGQKPPFRLLVRAIDSDTRRRSKGVSWAVSDAFVVATQRVKGAQKAEIPHVEEHVSKIENVGVQVCLLILFTTYFRFSLACLHKALYTPISATGSMLAHSHVYFWDAHKFFAGTEQSSHCP